MSKHTSDPNAETPTDTLPAAQPPKRGGIPAWIRRLAVPIILAWLAITVLVNVVVPQLDEVGKMRAVSMAPRDAPSMIAMMRIGKVFD